MKRLIGFICALIFVMGVYGVAGAASVTFDAVPPEPIVGSTFTVSISGLDFPATDGGDVLVEWDPSILSITVPDDVDLTPWPGDFSGVSSVSAGSLNLSLSVFASASPIGDFGIADLMFTASAVGDSPFTLTPSGWVGPFADGFPPIDVTGAAGTITVTAPVPIPGSILLLGSGLVGLVGLVRRRRS